MAPPPPPPPCVLQPLATFKPACNTRAWQTVPHPTQPLVATACADRTVRVYSLTSFNLVHTISGGHKRSIRTVSWKPGVKDQSVLATGSFDATAGIWRRDERRLEEDFTQRRSVDEEAEDEDYNYSCILEGHESEIKSIAWSPSGQYLATCARDKSVWIWEELEDDNFETVAVLQEHDQDVKCVTWHPEEDLLASASYDDTVRLYKEDADDWVQVAMIDGHKETVWWAEFEGSGMAAHDFRAQREGLSEGQLKYIEALDSSGPRLVTCSDDRTVRIWRRKPRVGGQATSTTGIPSIIRSFSTDEDWLLEAVLPQRHERAVYSVSWSRKTGMIVSTSSDGKIIVCKERWKSPISNGVKPDQSGDEKGVEQPTEQPPSTEWVVVAELYSAHDVFEVNHVCWAGRRDKGRRREDEEVIVSTGDDGEVKVWTLEDRA